MPYVIKIIEMIFEISRFLFYKMVAVAILDFQNSPIFQMAQMHYCAKFRQLSHFLPCVLFAFVFISQNCVFSGFSILPGMLQMEFLPVNSSLNSSLNDV